MNENEVAKVLVDAAIDVHRSLGGPGLLESVTLLVAVAASASLRLCVFAPLR